MLTLRDGHTLSETSMLHISQHHLCGQEAHGNEKAQQGTYEGRTEHGAIAGERLQLRRRSHPKLET